MQALERTRPTDLRRQALDNSTLKAALQDEVQDTIEQQPTSFKLHSFPQITGYISGHENGEEVLRSSAIKLMLERSAIKTPTISETEDQKAADVTESDEEPRIEAPPVNSSPSIRFESFKMIKEETQKKYYTIKTNLRTAQRKSVLEFKQKLKRLNLTKQCQKLKKNYPAGRRRWKLLRDVLRTVMLLKHHHAVNISDNLSEHICSEHFLTSERNDSKFGVEPRKSSAFFSDSGVEINIKQMPDDQDKGDRNITLPLEELIQEESPRDTTQPSSPNLRARGGFSPRKLSSPLRPSSPVNSKTNIVKQGLDKKRKNDRFFSLITNGRESGLHELQSLIKQDPANNLYVERDPRHILNRCNENNLTPLYLACHCGHLNTVKFLAEMGADIHISSQIAKRQRESNLEVASRWNFIAIVDFLLRNGKWSRNQLMSARSLSQNKAIREVLLKEIRKTKKKGCMCFS